MIAFILSLCFLYYFLFWKKRSLSESIPGPPGLPLVGNILQITPREAIVEMERWAFKYGPIYKLHLLGYPTIVISSMKDIQAILKQRPSQYRGGDQPAKVLKELGLPGLFTLEGVEWKESRNIIAPALSMPRVSQMTASVLKHAFELRTTLIGFANTQQRQMTEWFCEKSGSEKRLEYHPSQLVSFLPPIQRCILNIILETSLCYEEKPLFSEELLRDINHLFANINENCFFPLRSWMGYRNADDRKAKNTCQKIAAYAQDIITAWKFSNGDTTKETRTTDENRSSKSHYTLLQDILDSDHHLSEEAIIGNIGQVLVAAYESTAGSLLWCLYYLAKYPKIQRKIQEEAARVIPKSIKKGFEGFSFLGTQHFPYTLCFVKEVLRLRPAAPITGLATNQDTQIMGHFIPKDTRVILLTRLAMTLETPPPNPFEFCPERWECDDMALANGNLSFGAGPRICPGRHLAILEMVLITACVFSYFDISFFPSPPGHDEIHEVTEITTKPNNLLLLLKVKRDE